jgi:acyl dehydratase
MADLLYFDDLAVGDRWVSSPRPVTEDDVVRFADLTGDYNPLHLDEDFARETPFRRPIAHGLLGLSLAAGIGSESPLVHTIAFLGVHQWQFLQPIYYDDRLHVVTEVLSLARQGRKRGRVLWKRSLVNQQAAVVQQGRFESLVGCAASANVGKPGRGAANGKSMAVPSVSDRQVAVPR